MGPCAETVLLEQRLRILVGVVIDQAPRQSVQLRLGLGDRRIGRELGEEVPGVRALHPRSEPHGEPDVRAVGVGPAPRPRQRRLGRKHADHLVARVRKIEDLGIRSCIQRKRQTDDVRIAAESALPIAMRQHGNIRCRGVVVGHLQGPTEHGPRADQHVRARADQRDQRPGRSARRLDVHPNRAVEANAGQRPRLVAKLEILRKRPLPLGVGAGSRHLAAQDHQPLRIRVAERVEHDVRDQCVCGRCRAETHAKRQHRRRRERGCAHQALRGLAAFHEPTR